MIARLPPLLLRYGLPFLVVAALCAWPLWQYRCERPEAYADVLAAAGGPPAFLGGLERFELVMIALVLQLVTGIALLSILPGRVLSRLARVPHPWIDALAIALPRVPYGAFVAMTLGLILMLSTALLGYGLLGGEATLFSAGSAALVLVAVSARGVSAVGELVQMQRPGVNRNDPRAYKRRVALVVFPLLCAYVAMPWLLPHLWSGRLLAGRSPEEALLVVGLAEALVLVLASLTWAIAWHTSHGGIEALEAQEVAEAFA